MSKEAGISCQNLWKVFGPNPECVFELIDNGASKQDILEQTNRAAAWAKENEIEDWDKVAIWYMKTYEDRWKTWVPTDIFNKVKDVLDKED